MDKYCSNCGSNQHYVNSHTGLCDKCTKALAEESLRGNIKDWNYITSHRR